MKLYKAAFYKRRHESMEEIITGSTPENAATLIPFLAKEKIDLDRLRAFLEEHEDKIGYENSNYASYFRKLAALYDQLRYGW